MEPKSGNLNSYRKFKSDVFFKLTSSKAAFENSFAKQLHQLFYLLAFVVFPHLNTRDIRKQIVSLLLLLLIYNILLAKVFLKFKGCTLFKDLG